MISTHLNRPTGTLISCNTNRHKLCCSTHEVLRVDVDAHGGGDVHHGGRDAGVDDALAAGRQQVESDLVEATSRLLADGRQLDGARALRRRHHNMTSSASKSNISIDERINTVIKTLHFTT